MTCNKKIKIAIVGVGFSGTMVTRFLSEMLEKNSKVELLLFEKSSQLGAGMVYGSQFNDECFILNMQSALLSANSNNSNEFLEWLRLKKHLTSEKNEDNYYSQRYLMGMYLEEIIQKSLLKFKQKNIPFNIISEEILNIVQEKGDYCLIGKKNKYKVERIVLAIGHLPRVSPFNHNKYIANPYHSINTLSKINKSASIGILGSKLTAVDIAIILDKYGSKNKVMFSKSGRLPLVRGILDSNTQDLDDLLIHNDSKSSLSNFLRFLRNKFKILNIPSEYKGFINCKDQKRRLELELIMATKHRTWHNIFDATKHYIDKYWIKLDTKQKKLFLNKYYGIWTSYRHPMPFNNAEKIYQMLKKEELKIYSNHKLIRISDNNKFEVTLNNNKVLVFDYIVDATGTPSNIYLLDSTLIKNLINGKFISAYESGGVEFNTETHELHNMKGVFVIGPLTYGKIFYTSSIERLMIHANIISSNLVLSTF